MAQTSLGNTAAHEVTLEGELHIELCRDCSASYTGTAAQLQDEGLIPAGFHWPTADTRTRWNDGKGYCYILNRIKPPNHRGPKGSWHSLDYWTLRVEMPSRGCDWHSQRQIQRKKEDLKLEQWLLTNEGKARWAADWAKFCATVEDNAFQRFKELIPGLEPRRKAAIKTQGARA